jgi:hypothetical protein
MRRTLLQVVLTIIVVDSSWYGANKKADDDISSTVIIYMVDVEACRMLTPQGNFHVIVTAWNGVLGK